jgi:hypothetical protein
MPESGSNECDAKVTGRIGHTQIHRRLGDVSLRTNLSESWHSVYSIGRGMRRGKSPFCAVSFILRTNHRIRALATQLAASACGQRS